MKFKLLSLLLSFLAFTAHSQAVDDLFKRNIDAHIDLVPLGFPDAAVRFGSELMMGKRWSTGLNLGVGVPVFGNTGMGFREPRWKGGYQLFEVRPEIKFYWFKRQRMGWYLAAEPFAMFMNGTTGKSYHFLSNEPDRQLNFDQADFEKRKLGMIGKIGGRFLMGKRFTLDFFTGIGLSDTDSNYKNYVNVVAGPADPFFEGENYETGRRSTGHLSAGLRLGMVLWHKK